MLEVRRVRVGDVKLTDLFRRRTLTDDEAERYPDGYDGQDRPRVSADGQKWIGDPEEGVLMKAAVENAEFRAIDRAGDIDWASLHMNLSLQNAVAPGAELLMAVMDRPKTEEFMSAYGGSYGPCRVNLPEDSVFSFTIGANKVKFHGNQAQVFVRALLYHWFVYKEEMPAKTFAATPDGVCEVDDQE